MLHYRSERNRRYNSVSYVKAVCMEQVPPTYNELKHAYHLAGQSFVGKLKEVFLVLDDDMAKKTSKSGGSKQTTKPGKPAKEVRASASKRHASGDTSNDVRKKMPATQ
jgi:hypothetical protein